MASAALGEWAAGRQRRLAQLWHIRDGLDLPWQARQADMMIIMKLAAEFHGFARSLHDEAAEFLASGVAAGNQLLASTLQGGLTGGRALNRNNAGTETLASDFARIGVILWPAINAQEPARGPRWYVDLRNLMEMRNAIAHDNQARLVGLETAGLVIDRSTTRAWHESLDLLAVAMDDVVASYFAALLGVTRPW